MKNKFLAILAAGSAIVGGSLASAPAQALTVSSDTTVTVNVPEVLILRTVPSITLNLNGSAIFGTSPTGTVTSTAAGITYKDQIPADAITYNADGTQTGFVNQTSPVLTGASVATIPLNDIYAVWSNSTATTGTNVTVTPGSSGALTGTGTAAGATATLAVATGGNQNFTPAGLVNPALVGDITVSVDLANATKAGPYGGTLTITANTP